MLPLSCKPLSPEDQVKKIMAENNLVVLINGSIESPIDDNSKAMVKAMFELKCEFTAIDVHAKPAFLKSFPADQAVPYVFLKGIPACSVEGVDALALKPEFKNTMTPRALTLNERIEQLLNSADVLLFMKGTPESP